MLPVTAELLSVEAIQIDGDIHDTPLPEGKLLQKNITPGIAGNGLLPADGKLWIALLPRENPEPSGLERVTGGKKIMGPAELEIPASPDLGRLKLAGFKGAIDPAAAGPAGRTDIPVGMIVE